MNFGRRSASSAGLGTSVRNARKLAKSARLGGSDLNVFPSSIQFYDVSPKEDISLEEFEELALERLEVLRTVEKHASLSAAKYSLEWRENIEKELRKLGLEAYLNIYESCAQRQENRRKDNYSHFILRLAYCRTEELRRWFITQEMDLLKLRFHHLSPDEIQSFMSNNQLNFFPIDDEEKQSVLESLNQCANYGLNPSNSNYYKVHFTEALDLVRNRRVYVKGGMCYVPQSDIVTLLLWMFKSLLQQNLALTSKTLPNLDEDERLVKMLSDLDKRYTGSDYSVQEGQEGQVVKPDMIQGLSEKSFPLCMRSMQKTLNKSHHIKYKARLQYGLFLKGIGLSLEDALKFFRGEFTKAHIDADKFDKEYTYGIRYNYGYEGKKVNWAPWNCMKIIMDNVGPGENHGCPFRHYDQDLLKTELIDAGVKESDELKDVMTATKEGHYQKACACQFRAIHGYDLSTGITNHPNQYYQESIGGAKSNLTQKSNLKTEKVMVFK